MTFCPECQQGKCGNCTGVGLDEDTDMFVDCDCEKHQHFTV